MDSGRRTVTIRAARASDRPAVWRAIAPTVRAGDTWPLPRDWDEAETLAFWFASGHEVFVAEDADGAILGSYILKANSTGAAAHVANAGYIVAPEAWGRGIGRAMCAHSLERARERGFRAMQYNLVVDTNERAKHLWQSCGFEIVGRLPDAFDHPRLGYVDALVMHRKL